jgi:hypothetical protein
MQYQITLIGLYRLQRLYRLVKRRQSREEFGKSSMTASILRSMGPGIAVAIKNRSDFPTGHQEEKRPPKSV